LWLALKAKRLELAREQGVPPYVIFHDSTLLGILSQRPATLDELARVSGVGQAKLARVWRGVSWCAERCGAL